MVTLIIQELVARGLESASSVDLSIKDYMIDRRYGRLFVHFGPSVSCFASALATRSTPSPWLPLSFRFAPPNSPFTQSHTCKATIVAVESQPQLCLRGQFFGIPPLLKWTVNTECFVVNLTLLDTHISRGQHRYHPNTLRRSWPDTVKTLLQRPVLGEVALHPSLG